MGRELSEATELTSIIASAEDQFAKAVWNLSRYLKEQSAWKPKANSVVFAAIDFAKAANSLIDWIAKERGHEPVDIVPNVRWAGALRTMANVAKHGESRKDYWPGGRIVVQVVSQRPNEARIFMANTPREIEERMPAWNEKDRPRWEVWLLEGTGAIPAARAFNECLTDLRCMLDKTPS